MAGALDGKSCVITGAAFGIGRATAVRFAAEGGHLVLADIQEQPLLALAKELRGRGAVVETSVCNVSVAGDVKRIIDLAVSAFGRLDVAVANAGIIPLTDILESTPELWDEVMAVDGRGMFLTCKYSIEAMLATGGGSIVCTSSISGVEGQKRQAVYGPAKFVASGLTKHLAIEWADRGIRVNAVAPGTIMTERVKRLPEEPGGADYLAVLEKAHPIGRIGTPAEVAAAILFLASAEASFITGVILPVDGGYLAQ